MAGDPNRRGGDAFAPITDEQKRAISIAFVQCLESAMTFELEASGRPSLSHYFRIPKAPELVDVEGMMPESAIILPFLETDLTYEFRILVNKIRINPPHQFGEDYKVAIRKGTIDITDVRKATVTADLLRAVDEDAGTSVENIMADMESFGESNEVSEGIQAAAALGTKELEAQWTLGECSSDEADELLRILQNMRPDTLPDIFIE